MLSSQLLNNFAQLLVDNHVTLSQLLCAFIRESEPTEPVAALQQELRSAPALNTIVCVLISTPHTAPIITRIARNIAVRSYAHELSNLLSASAGFHFNVAHAKPSQFLGFSSMRMARTFETTCPGVWHLFGALLNVVAIQNKSESANAAGDYLTEITYRYGNDKPTVRMPHLSEADVAAEMLGDLPDDWDAAGDAEDLVQGEDQFDGPQLDDNEGNVWSALTGTPRQKREGKAVHRQMQRTYVRRLALFGICINTSNMRCNAFQAIVGMFAHVNDTSEEMVEFLSHAGLSISPQSISGMVKNMSTEAEKSLKNELAHLSSAMAYDNLEVRFDTEQPTPENPGGLVGMTTGAFIPLRPGATKDDLCVSEELWARSVFNLHRSLPPVVFSHERIMSIWQQSSFKAEDPRSIQSYFAWLVRDMLLNDNVNTISPALKQHFRKEELGLPVARSSIPPTKTTHKPMRTMNISVSSTHGNAEAIENMLAQGGAVPASLRTHVILIHGDLGTGDKVLSLQECRGIEHTPWDRYQSLVYAPALFHTRMAFADTIHRLWIEPERPRPGHSPNPLSIFHLCTILRPREIGKISTNPGFRRTHSLIENVALSTITDAWRLVVEEKHGVSLQDWKPSWEEVVVLSHEVVSKYVAALSYRPSHPDNPTGDMVQDQVRLFNQHALLYLGTTRAARYGDVQCIQDFLPIWIYMLRVVGKHKYARHLGRFYIYLNGGWPGSLSKVVQDNWLVNPTGKPDGFRGVDWIIERDNLFQKQMYSGSGSNRTPENLIKQSLLTQDYQAAYGVMEREFHLRAQTTRHPPPITKTSIQMVRTYLENNKISTHQCGRKLSSQLMNAYSAGLYKTVEEGSDAWLAVGDNLNDEGTDMEEAEGAAEPEDLSVDE